MAKQTFTAGQVLTAAQMNSLQANDYNWSVDTKTDSYVLVAGDAGKRIVMNAATAKTITVNTSIFTAGDTVWIHNINSGTCTVTAGTATVNTAGSLALAQWEGGALYFTSASSAIFFRGGGATYGVATGGSSSSITVSGQNYTLLTFTATGTLTVTKSGLFDVLLVGGGAGGGGGGGDADRSIRSGGGGGAGGIVQSTIYLDANQTVTIGAGGSGTNPPTNGNASAIGGSRGISVAGGGIGCAQYNASNNGNFGKPEVGASGGGGTNSTSATNSRTGAASMADGILGKAGGDGVSSDTQGQGAGGGGGFSAVGGNASTSTGGAGGAGYDVSAFIAGSALFKAGGGGGGGNTGGAGGSSIGGAGGSNAAGSSASANTGGGGGGAGFGTGAGGTGGRNGGSGGSGIVYVRFKV